MRRHCSNTPLLTTKSMFHNHFYPRTPLFHRHHLSHRDHCVGTADCHHAPLSENGSAHRIADLDGLAPPPPPTEAAYAPSNLENLGVTTLAVLGTTCPAINNIAASECLKKQGLHHAFNIGGTGSVHWGDGDATTCPTYSQFRFLLRFRPLYFAKRHAKHKKLQKK